MSGEVTAPTQFRFEFRTPIRFRDLDALQHLNHAAYFTLVEDARVVYFRDIMGVAIPERLVDWALAQIGCKYRLPLKFGDTAIIRLRTSWLKNSSYGAAFEIHANELGRIAAEGELVQVHVNPETGKSAPLPARIRQAIIDFEGLQA